MKRFLINIVQMAILVVCLLGVLFVVNKKYFVSDVYLMELPVKRELLRDVTSPRVVLIGGSNVAFGLDSKRISDHLHQPVINAALHAGLGMKYILDTSMPLLRKGDTVVLMPEYAHFFGTSSDGEAKTSGMIPYIGECSDLLSFNYRQLKTVIVGFCKTTAGSPFNYLGERKAAMQHHYIYTKQGFNEYGDEVSHWTLPTDAVMTKENVGTSNYRKQNEEFINYFAKCVQELRSRGCHVILLPPAVSRDYMQDSMNQITKLVDTLKKKGMTFAAPPSDFMYPISCMYNTPYHINNQGVNINTAKICAVLENMR